MHGGGVEVGPPEMPGVHQRSTFIRKMKIVYMCIYIIENKITLQL